MQKIIKREFAFLIIYLDLEDMFEILFVEFEIFGINVIHSFVDCHDFLILIFKFLQFALLNLEAAI